MIIEKRKWFFLKSLRIILDDEKLTRVFREKKYSYITGLSYHRFNFGTDVSVKHKQTILINLDQSPETILQQFHDTTRNEVRRTFRLPELSFVADDQNEAAARALYARFKQFQKRQFPFPRSLKDHKLFGSYRHNELIAAILCYDAPPVLRARAIFSHRHEARPHGVKQITSFAARRLIYEICLWGATHGYHIFDLGAINTHDPVKASITQFKQGFGGRAVDEYTYTYKGLLARLLTH